MNKKQMMELCTDIKKCTSENWKEKSRNIADWEKCIKEGEVHVGL